MVPENLNPRGTVGEIALEGEKDIPMPWGKDKIARGLINPFMMEFTLFC